MSLNVFANGRRLLSVALAAAALLVAGATQANAGNIQLQIQQGATTVNVVGLVAGPNAFISGPVTVGDYTIRATIGASNTTGDQGGSTLDISSLVVTRNSFNSGADLLIKIAVDGFLLPAGDPLFLGGGMTANFVGLTGAGSTVSFRSFFDDANSGGFGAGVGTSAVGVVAPADDAALGKDLFTKQVDNDATFPFSLSSITRVNLTALNLTGAPFSVTTTGATIVRDQPFGPPPVPEPASIALACMGLIGFGGYARRKVKTLA